jgi:hypothetical protein
MVALVVIGACGGGGHGSSPLTAVTTIVPATTVTTGTTSAGGPSTSAATTIVPTTSPSTVLTPTTSVPKTSPTTSAAATSISLADADGGRTVAVHRGDTVTVVLHSTYWAMKAPSNPAAVQQDGTSVVAPTMNGCVPGGGCGTVTTHYRAVGDGQSQLAAHRDSCGEAMRCQGTAGDWHVTVVVSG